MNVLQWKKQLSAVSHCGFFHLRNIAKSKCYLTEKSLLIVDHAFINNKKDYLNSLLFGLPNILLYRLQHLQNSTAKLITGKQKYDHNTPELIKLHWLPVKERISFKILLITFKCLNNLAPKYLSDLISMHKQTRHICDLQTLRYAKNRQVIYGGRALSYAAPFLWINCHEK